MSYVWNVTGEPCLWALVTKGAIDNVFWLRFTYWWLRSRLLRLHVKSIYCQFKYAPMLLLRICIDRTILNGESMIWTCHKKLENSRDQTDLSQLILSDYGPLRQTHHVTNSSTVFVNWIHRQMKYACTLVFHIYTDLTVLRGWWYNMIIKYDNQTKTLGYGLGLSRHDKTRKNKH